MAVLETKEVFYSYAKGNKVLSGVNAVFETGMMYAILGPSGSGKTTLLSLLGGLDSPQKEKSCLTGKTSPGTACNITAATMSP